MSPILSAVIVVTVIGVACGVMLSVASKVMAVAVDERAARLRQCLPGANCGACGYAGCGAYADALAADHDVKTTLCVPGGNKTAGEIAEVLGIEAGKVVPMTAHIRCGGTCINSGDKYEWNGEKTCRGSLLMFGGKNICPYGCIGYGDCIAACPQNAIRVEDGISKINVFKCVGCGLCLKACPTKIIELIPRSQSVTVNCNNRTKGRVAMDVCRVSCIGCGRCVRVCAADAVRLEDNIAVIDPVRCTGCGECAAECPRKSITVR